MYQHPATLELMASYHQQDLLREAEAHRLAHPHEAEEGNRPGQVQRRMIAVAVALVAVLAAVALI